MVALLVVAGVAFLVWQKSRPKPIEVMAAGIGLLAGVLPARHAAGLNPVDAIRAE